MRVAFVVPSFPELSETFILRQITGLLDREHDVRIIAQRRGSGAVHPQILQYSLIDRTHYLMHSATPPGDFAAREPQRARATRMPSTSRIARAALEAQGQTPSRSPRKQIAALHRVATLLREPHPDIVHCHYGETALHYGFAAVLWAVPLVVSFYGYDASSYPARHGHHVYRRLFRQAAVLTALSDRMKRRLVELGADPARVVIQPLPVDPAEFSFHDRSSCAGRPPRLLTVARFTEKKGIEYAIRAFARVLPQESGLEYHLIGDGPLRPALEELASSLGLGERIRFTGAMAGPDIARAMHAADIFLLPSVIGSDADEEGTPTVLLEAAACGLPVLSTWHAGIPEIVEHDITGLLVPERDVDALTAALRTLLADADRRLRMGREARRRIEARFDIRLVARRLEEIYAGALAHTG